MLENRTAKTGAMYLAYLSVVLFTSVISIATAVAEASPAKACRIEVVNFLPEGYVSDGSESYQTQLQTALDAVPATGGDVVFAPITYLISNPSGLRVRSNQTLHMQGAKFLVSDKCMEDGQVFLGQDITNLRLHGGAITGRNDLYNTPTAHYLVANNVIETDQNQIAAIRVDTRTETQNIAIQGNLFVGDNRRILVEGPDQKSVTIEDNPGGKPDRVTDDE